LLLLLLLRAAAGFWDERRMLGLIDMI